VKGPKDYHRIVYLQKEENLHPTESRPSADVLEGAEAKPAAFRTIDARIRLEIEEQKPSGRYGSKLDMLTKHLILIGQESPLEKTIVFSAFKRGLDLVADALRHSESRRMPPDASLLLCLADDPVPTSRLLDGLRFAYADSSGRNTAVAVREFTTGDTSILLLHSETTSAGLNLVATKNVILLEPLVNSGTERQALGRVSRIGQTKETNVFLYFLKGSVEERILHLAAGRGQSLYLRDQEQGQERDSGALIAGHGSGSGNTREKGDCKCRDGSGQGTTKRHSRNTPLSPQMYTRLMTFSLASLQNTWVQGRGQLAR
jgi:E3 ubiquitin-protein ligase SHPRH